jgi:CBS domain-containing protein
MQGMKKIRDIVGLREEIYSVQTTESVRTVARYMKDRGIRAVCVLNRQTVAGIVSNWDFLTKVLAEGRDPDRTTVGEVMTPQPMTVSPDATYAECLVTMLENDFQHLVVVTPDGQMRGLVAIGDLLKIDKAERDAVVEFYQEMFASHH